jgi:hypothetical protein
LRGVMLVAEQYGLKTPNSGVYTSERTLGARGSLHELEPCTKFKTHTVAHPGGSSLERLRLGWFFMQF